MDDEDYQYEEVPDEEKLKIAQHFLLQSPPGQVFEVLKDVKKLVPSHVLSDDVLQNIIHTHNVEAYLPAKVDGDRNILICEDTEVDKDHYADLQAKKVYGYDHMKQRIIPDDVSELPIKFVSSSYENERQAVQNAIQQYTNEKYPNQCDSAVVVQDESILVVVMSAQRLSLKNYWSGRWKSRWQLNCSDSPATLSGTVTIHVHYFEDGNLQLQTKKEESCQVEFTDPESLGREIVEAIRKAEDVIQSSLEEMYINMSQETLKEMRRVTPITQTKMDWNINQHRSLASLVQRSAT